MAEQWSQDVTGNSDALDLEEGVFTRDDPREVAKSLKRSAERSDGRKGYLRLLTPIDRPCRC